MKIRAREVGLLAVGFVLGAILTRPFVSAPPQSAVAPASAVVNTGPVLAAAWSLFPNITVTGFQSPAAPVHFFIEPQFPDNPRLYGPTYLSLRDNLDLIDFRHRPDITLDDLK